MMKRFAVAVTFSLPVGLAVLAKGQPEPEMARLAASMQPGEMRELVTKNCDRGLFKTWYDWEEADIKKYGSQKMFDIICYNNEMKWDPATRQVLVINGGHYASFKFITYSADANEWRLMEVPPWLDPRRPDAAECGKEGRDGNPSWPRTHFYDRLAISPERRIFAVNWRGGQYHYNMDTGAWSPLIKTSADGKDAYLVMEYFPEMNGFVFATNWGRHLRLWDVQKRAERDLGSYPFGIHGVMEYNPVHEVMVFGAGDAGGGEAKGHPNLYLLNNEGKVARLKPPPIHITCTPRSKLLCDPASGEYVAQDRADGKFHAFQPILDEWKELPGLRLPEAESLGVAIDTYGVMMFLSRGKGGFRCHLYKHKPAFARQDKPAADATFSALAEAKVLEGAAMEPKLDPPDALPPAPDGQAWKLVWHDEFEGEKLDETKWEFLEGKWRTAACTRKAVSLDGKGRLAIRTFKEGEDYFTGVVRTRGKFDHTFGFYVARIQLQKQPGHWSAFWLWNVGTKDAPTLEGSPLRFEVDIMERPWTDDRVQHTLHWGPYPKGGKSLGHEARVPGVGEGWHTFAVLWTPDEFVFYVDGKETWRPRGVDACQRPLYILLSDEAEFGGWAGDVRKAALPDEFLTDYVRVYDLVDAKTGLVVWKPKPLK